MCGKYDKMIGWVLACLLACPTALNRWAADRPVDTTTLAGERAATDSDGPQVSDTELAESRKSASDDEPDPGQLGPCPLPIGFLERCHTVWQYQVQSPRPVEQILSRAFVQGTPSWRPAGAASHFRSRPLVFSTLASQVHAHAPPALHS